MKIRIPAKLLHLFWIYAATLAGVGLITIAAVIFLGLTSGSDIIFLEGYSPVESFLSLSLGYLLVCVPVMTIAGVTASFIVGTLFATFSSDRWPRFTEWLLIVASVWVSSYAMIAVLESDSLYWMGLVFIFVVAVITSRLSERIRMPFEMARVYHQSDIKEQYERLS